MVVVLCVLQWKSWGLRNAGLLLVPWTNCFPKYLIYQVDHVSYIWTCYTILQRISSTMPLTMKRKPMTQLMRIVEKVMRKWPSALQWRQCGWTWGPSLIRENVNASWENKKNNKDLVGYRSKQGGITRANWGGQAKRNYQQISFIYEYWKHEKFGGNDWNLKKL